MLFMPSAVLKSRLVLKHYDPFCTWLVSQSAHLIANYRVFCYFMLIKIYLMFIEIWPFVPQQIKEWKGWCMLLVGCLSNCSPGLSFKLWTNVSWVCSWFFPLNAVRRYVKSKPMPTSAVSCQ
jgi:hypothetical protein